MKQINSTDIIIDRDITKVGIFKGMSYDEASEALVAYVCKQTDIEVDLSCLFDDCDGCDCGVVSNAEEAVECLRDAVKGWNADKIDLGEAQTNGLFKGVSQAAVELSGKKIPYKIEMNQQKGTAALTYDLNSFASELPDACTLSNTRVVAYGRNEKRGVVLRDTDSRSTSIILPYDKFPVNVDFDLRVATKDGDIKLWGTAVVPCPTNLEDNLYLDITDYTSSAKKSGRKLSDFIEAITGKMRVLFNYIEGLRTYRNNGGEYVQSSVGIQSTLGVLVATVDKLCKDNEDLKQQISECNCGSESDCN